MKILDRSTPTDISGIQDVQSSKVWYDNSEIHSDENGCCFGFRSITDQLQEVECKSIGRKFRILYSLNPETIKSEVADSLNCANSFWNLPDINVQPTRFIDYWAYDRKFNSRYSFGFVNCDKSQGFSINPWDLTIPYKGKAGVTR